MKWTQTHVQMAHISNTTTVQWLHTSKIFQYIVYIILVIKLCSCDDACVYLLDTNVNKMCRYFQFGCFFIKP